MHLLFYFERPGVCDSFGQIEPAQLKKQANKKKFLNRSVLHKLTIVWHEECNTCVYIKHVASTCLTDKPTFIASFHHVLLNKNTSVLCHMLYPAVHFEKK